MRDLHEALSDGCDLTREWKSNTGFRKVHWLRIMRQYLSHRFLRATAQTQSRSAICAEDAIRNLCQVRTGERQDAHGFIDRYESKICHRPFENTPEWDIAHAFISFATKQDYQPGMHELSVTSSIFEIVEKHAVNNHAKRVVAVNLEIGALSNLKNEWIQRYFDLLSAGTVAEGARLMITRVPAVFRCNQCQQLFEIISFITEELLCRQCPSEDIVMISGKEYHIKDMEAEI